MWKYQFTRLNLIGAKNLSLQLEGKQWASGAAADVKIWTTNNFRLISPVQTNSECKKSKLVFNGFSLPGFCTGWIRKVLANTRRASYGCPLVTGN